VVHFLELTRYSSCLMRQAGAEKARPMEHDRNSEKPHPTPAYAPDLALGAAEARDAANSANSDAANSDAATSMNPFQMTVELAAIGVAHLDLSGRFLYANPALCQLTGYTREELLSLTFRDIIHPDEVAERVPPFRHLNAGETLALSACRLKRQYSQPERPVIWARVTLMAPRLTSSALQYLILNVEDISERKEMEEGLLTANQQLTLSARDSQQASDLAAILDAMTDLVIVFDGAGRIRRVNQATIDLLGIHPTLEAGRRYMGLEDAQGLPVLPERWVSRRVLLGETLTGAQAVDMQAEAGRGRKMLLSVNGAPVRDSQGQIVGGVLVMRDVTEHRKLERRTQEALHALLQMAQTLVAPTSNLPPAPQSDMWDSRDAPSLNPTAQRLADLAARVLGCRRVGIVSLEGDSALMHPIALTGLTPEQARVWIAGLDGRSMIAFIGAERMRKLRAGETVELDLEQQPLRSVAHGGPVALAAPLRVGEQLVGALALGYEQEPHAYTEDELALASALGQLAALVIERERFLHEREESRASVLALREANRRMDEFLGIAAHELRTPLTTLLGSVHLLKRRLARISLNDGTREDLANQLQMISKLLESMDQQGWRLSRLASDMVDTSRIKTGQLEINAQPCDLAAIVKEAVEEQRLANPQRTIELILPDDARTLVVGDADRLGQVVTNYLTNALKYSPEDRPVETRLRIDGDTARVSVRDEGPGLPEEAQSQVWELFHRASGVVVQSGSGIGLGMGLHICKTIIERHGGRVGAESALGQGSIFWFTLPLANDANRDTANRAP
jgi:PAS domain S-box-containing protein